MTNPPRPTALENHPHRTPSHFTVYDGVRELAIYQATGWHKSGVSHERIRNLHPEAALIIDQLTSWGIWNVEPCTPLGFRVFWDDYSLIVQGNETHD